MQTWTWQCNYYFNSSTWSQLGSLLNHTTSDTVCMVLTLTMVLWFGRNGTWYSSSWATTGDPANGVNPTVSGIRSTTKTYVANGYIIFNGSGS